MSTEGRRTSTSRHRATRLTQVVSLKPVRLCSATTTPCELPEFGKIEEAILVALNLIERLSGLLRHFVGRERAVTICIISSQPTGDWIFFELLGLWLGDLGAPAGGHKFAQFAGVCSGDPVVMDCAGK